MGIRGRERMTDVALLSAIFVGLTVLWYALDHRLWLDLAKAGIDGLLLSAVLVGVGRRRYRNAFVVGGQRASDEERAAAVAALRSGQLPREPGQVEAAVTFARYQLGPATSVWPVAVACGLAALGSAVFAVPFSQWYWLMVAAWIVFAAAEIAYLLRLRRRARALLMTPFLEPIG